MITNPSVLFLFSIPAVSSGLRHLTSLYTYKTTDDVLSHAGASLADSFADVVERIE